MSDDEVDFVDGVIEKKGYRSKWLRHARAHSGHPINYGIHMDTHHLVSAEAIKQTELSEELVDKGYMINDIKNLVGFPATLPAACHLGLQLHRGDHYHKKTPNEEPYHKYVKNLIREEKETIKGCYERTKIREKSTEIHGLLDPISKKILRRINSNKLPLTNIFINFDRVSGRIYDGCKNCFDVVDARVSISSCNKKGNHFGDKDLRYQQSNVTGNSKVINYNGDWTPEVGL
jgi:hypothetical protein